MRMLIITYLFSLCFSISYEISAQQDSTKPKPYSVIIMPFYSDLRYPYDNDLFRESLIRSFHRKGYDVVLDDSSWSIILDLDYNLSNIFPSDADSISNSIDVDLIVSGHLFTTLYQPNIYSFARRIRNPVPIRVFDTRKKEIVLRESLKLTVRRELVIDYYTFEELGDYIVRRLQLLGYKM